MAAVVSSARRRGCAPISGCASLSLSLSDFLPFLFGYSVNAGWGTTALDFLCICLGCLRNSGIVFFLSRCVRVGNRVNFGLGKGFLIRLLREFWKGKRWCRILLVASCSHSWAPSLWSRSGFVRPRAFETLRILDWGRVLWWNPSAARCRSEA